MSRTWAVVKREFTEVVRRRSYRLMTVLFPVFYVGVLAFFVLIMRGGGEARVTIVDATGVGLGQRVEQTLTTLPPGADASKRTTFHASLLAVGAQDTAEARSGLLERIEAKQLDGYILLPPGVLTGAEAVYEGRSSTNLRQMEQIRSAVQSAVQGARLADQGVDPVRLAAALRPIKFEALKAGKGAAQGTGQSLYLLGYILGFMVYLLVMIHGQAVMRSVLEEKKDRIVEVVVSSIRAKQLMLGKVLGIGGASLLQVGIWIVTGLVLLRAAPGIAARLGGSLPPLPQVPVSVAVTFLLFFALGFLLYASIFAALGAMATSDQDLQQLQFVPTMLLMVSYFVMFKAMLDPEGTVSVVASWVPISSVMVMPVRAAIVAVSPLEIAGSLAVLIVTGLGFVWVGGKIYRIGILATGKRPSLSEVVHWVRTA